MTESSFRRLRAPTSVVEKKEKIEHKMACSFVENVHSQTHYLVMEFNPKSKIQNPKFFLHKGLGFTTVDLLR